MTDSADLAENPTHTDDYVENEQIKQRLVETERLLTSLHRDATQYNENKQLPEFTESMAALLISLEELTDKIKEIKSICTERFDSYQHIYIKQLQDIDQTLTHFEEILTQAGIVRWRQAAEAALKEGQEHQLSIQNSMEQFQNVTQETMKRMEKMSTDTAARLNQVARAFDIKTFEQICAKHALSIEETTKTATRKFWQIEKVVFVQRLLLNTCLGITVAISFGYFERGEWPWERHQDVLSERAYGETLSKVWPQLTATEQARFKQLAGNVADPQ